MPSKKNSKSRAGTPRRGRTGERRPGARQKPAAGKKPPASRKPRPGRKSPVSKKPPASRLPAAAAQAQTEPILEKSVPPEVSPGPPLEEGVGLGMKRFQSAESQRRFSREVREAGKRIGLVPTMGAFHRGHVSLIEKARAQNDVVVVSVFVNPLQFGPAEDYERYPRDLARDIDLCRAAGVDAVFQPETAEMYPPGFTTKITVGPIGQRLCGAYRPGHFDGVCTVVAKLIGIVLPHRLYLGEKDAQQLIIVERMIRDLNLDAKVVACATVREEDGLAMSSRNRYLTAAQRAQAPKIHDALRIAQREILVCHTRDPRALEGLMREVIERETELRVEYIQMVDPETLEPRAVLEGRTLIAVRVQLGEAHLIDNLLINVPGGRMAMKFQTPGCEEGRPGGGPELRSRP